MAYDLVIRNGTLVDGTGAPRRRGDVAVQGDRIVAVGEVTGKGRREIDAAGKIVTPGFVDIHTHLDAQIAWDPIASSSCYHGVTSVVIGNCGVTFAPCKPEDRGYLAEMMESVEDIPKESINAGLPWDWETYGEYLESIDRMDKGVNVGGMVGHCAVRIHAMGERSLDEDPATDDDVARMCELVDEAISAGALGFSTSRTFLHKVPDGALCARHPRRPQRAIGHRPRTGPPRQGRLRRRAPDRRTGPRRAPPQDPRRNRLGGPTVRENNVRVTFGLAQSYRRPDLYRRVIGFAEEENAKGAQLRPQTSSRGIGGLFGLDHRTPFHGTPAWRELAALPFDQRVAALEDESYRARLLQLDAPPVIDLENGYILTDDDLDYVHDRSRTLAAYAERSGQTEVAAFVELNRKHRGRVQIWHPGLNQSMDAIEEMITNPTVAMGLGDSGAHVGQIMDASSPTWLLSYWVKTRGVMSLEEAIRGWTSDTAAIFGIENRGGLREGAYADINVIDFDNLAMELPEYKHDFPAGAGRFVQRGRGYEQVIVNGEVFMEHGEHTGALAGRTLRS